VKHSSFDIKLSVGNKKLGSIMNTSVVPVADCKRDAPCKKKCYALKAWRQYPNVRKAWSHNSQLWKTSPTEAANSVVRQLKAKRKPAKYFRINVAGDFINQTHLDAWKAIARICTETKFRAFTKRWDLDYQRSPTNLIIGWSMWPGCEDTAPEGARAWVQDGTETRIPRGAVECKNDCSICKVCWDNPPHDLWFHIH
jgi:hypothetical protein